MYGIVDLCEDYGMTLDELLDAYGMDSVVPAICIECGAIYEYEPDCASGRCDECDNDSVDSFLILLGVI